MLTGKHILITGASSGIGLEIASACLRENAQVTLTYNSTDNFSELKEKYGTKINNIFHMNVSDAASLNNTLEKLTAETFQGFVNAIGINIAGPLISLEEEQITQQLKTNLDSAIILTQTVVKNMIRKRSGSIVHLSSVSAHRFARGHAVYSASKAGLEGFTKAMASEVAKRGVRVNTISPGPVMTQMLKKSIEENGDEPHKRVPMNRLIETSEIADATLFMLCDKSTAITGVNLPVDGGYILW